MLEQWRKDENMKKVVWEDENGFNHHSLINNNMPMSDVQKGLLLDPPDITKLDWEEIVRDLHNLLVARGLKTMKDVNELQTLNNSILTVIAPRISKLYREQAYENTNGQIEKHNKEKN